MVFGKRLDQKEFQNNFVLLSSYIQKEVCRLTLQAININIYIFLLLLFIILLKLNYISKNFNEQANKQQADLSKYYLPAVDP